MKLDYVALTPSEILKYDYRTDKILSKYMTCDDFILTDGSKTSFDFDSKVYSDIKSRDANILRKVRLTSKDGYEYRLSDLAKSGEFGGKGCRYYIKQEIMELEYFRSLIFSSDKPIMIDNKKVKISDVFLTPGSPKSDFTLIDDLGNDAYWISHKGGKTFTDFQQWSGITKASGREISEHPEVIEFKKDLKKMYKEFKPGFSVMRPIEDRNLKMMSIYGNRYGDSKLGINNVSVALQGEISIVDSRDNYRKIYADMKLSNGEDPPMLYEPVLAATYRSDRSNFDIKNMRVGIMPIGNRAYKKVI